MSENELVRAIAPVVRQFELLKVPYFVGGSVASSAHGLPRTTIDVDIVAGLRHDQVTALCGSLSQAYYISRPMIETAILRESSFNLIHLDTMYKIDVFVCKRRDYDQIAFSRIQPGAIGSDEDPLPVFLASPEDVVLSKLEWFRLGNEVSQQQWNDVVGVLKVQQSAVDRDYLEHWAGELGVADLLQRAFFEASLEH